MNRWDEIKATALGVAHHVTQDPSKRNAMADDLITLIGQMIDAVGKGVAAEARNADLDRYGQPVWRPRCVDCGERHVGGCTATPDGVCCDTLTGGRNVRVPRCGECFRAEGDGHARGCKLAGCVAVHVAHDPRCVGCGEEGCNGSCCISI